MGRLPETGPSLRRTIERNQRQAQRAADASPYTRSGTSVTAEGRTEVTGQMQSWDYDGTSRTDLGTTGWMLGPDDGGASLLALNGVDVYADLSAKDVTILGLIDDLAATQADLATAQGTLAAQVAEIADLVSKVVKVKSFYAAASNFAVPNAWTTALEHSLTTPAGFTQAVVIATAWARIKNTSGATASSFGTLAQINGVSGPWDDDGAIPDNNFANLEATYATLVTGLTEGATIPLRTRVFSSPALSADADNEATINGVVLWLR